MRPAAAVDADALCAAHPRLQALVIPLLAACEAAASGRGEAARAAMLQGCAVAESLYAAPDAAVAAPLVLVWWLQAASTLFSAAAAPQCLDPDAADDALAMRRASHEAAEAWSADPQRTLEPSRRAAELLRRRSVSGAFALRHEESAWASLLALQAGAPPLRGCAAMLLLETHRAMRLWPRALFDSGGEGQALLISAADVLQRMTPHEREIVVARCDATGRVVVADAAFRAHAAAVAARALAALPPELRGGAAGDIALLRWAPAGDAEAAAAEAASEAARRLGPQRVARTANAARCALPSCSQAEPFAGAFARCGSCLRACYCCAPHRVEDTKRHSKDDCTPAAKGDAAAAAGRKMRYDVAADAPKAKARSSTITGLR